MTDKNVPLKVVFAPGCFDNFDGTQEELDELMAQIHQMVESGEIFENSTPIDMETLFEEEPELVEKIVQDSVSRVLQ